MHETRLPISLALLNTQNPAFGSGEYRMYILEILIERTRSLQKIREDLPNTVTGLS